ncbi:MAG: formate dehydrogenase accessory sulfurtransferase FdhD [Gammaproteobacteria bacterium]|nr:formate dehydrogenase accessory sulfurtransferase FdhD [Gammaproteobacteria bacterium]
MAADNEKQPTATSLSHQVWQWSGGEITQQPNDIAQETAVALVYNGISHVVMMATPADLAELALGFSLSEGIINSAQEISHIDICSQPLGIEVNISISSRAMWHLKQQRRNLTGRTGCGLCGAESLQQAMQARTSKAVIAQDYLAPDNRSLDNAEPDNSAKIKVSDQAIQRAVAQLQQYQPLQQLTGAVHGAAWCDLQGNIMVAKEDVGRHNALDKLVGCLLTSAAPITDLAMGFALISSRASYEMVIKAKSAGISMLVAVSAPTSLAISLAEQHGLTLVGFARDGRHTFYT